MSMVNSYDIPPIKLILEVSQALKKIDSIQAPEWMQYVKSGAHRERPVTQKDFWHIRAASLMRTLNKSGPIGVSKLRSKYGGARNRGVRPERFKKGSGSIIRHILTQLETAELVKKEGRGRILTTKGISLLDKAAAKIKRESKKEE